MPPRRLPRHPPRPRSTQKKPIMPRQYEFDDQENLVINKVVLGAKIWGLMAIIMGLASLGLGIYDLVKHPVHWIPIVGVIVGLAYVYLGWGNLKVSHSFDLVVRTEGKDIQHTMKALDDLSIILFLQGILIGPLVVAVQIARHLPF